MDDHRPYVDELFDEEFEPCVHRDRWQALCGSARRLARFYLDAARQVGCFCDQNHRCTWETGGIWIPIDVFEDGSPHSHMRPSQFTARQLRRPVSTSLDINEKAIFRARKAKRCADCDCPPFYDAGAIDTLKILAAFRPDLYERLRPSLARISENREAQRNWLSTLSDQLKDEVFKAKVDSRIEADHGVPRSKLERFYHLLPSVQKRIVRNTLVLPLCRRCNRIRGNSLYSTDRLLELYAKAWHAGNRFLAVRQDEAWFEIQKISAMAHHYETIKA